MIELVWDEKFKRIYKKWRQKHADLAEQFRIKMELFVTDPFHPSLKTHSLSGVLKGSWSLRINYEQRLNFKFLDKEKKKVLLIDIGTHKEVY
ncbi:MAG: type II toxin-antitoxin system mRNA interferase toxin, RelE/StbE family [Euryarchaeota archaeon]|nr:type II toxin-antitoxin system mRNA interferase toxin, RelE/StbE family [Euryarchaeota archaeon]